MQNSQAPGEPGERRCSHCGKAAQNLKKCSGCRQVRYCNAECQRAHWPQHKKDCRGLAKQDQPGPAAERAGEEAGPST